MIVTLLNMTVAGLVSRLGATTASSAVKPSLLLHQRIGERGLGGAAARPDEQIDMGDFVAFADQRFANAQFGDLRHVISSQQ